MSHVPPNFPNGPYHWTLPQDSAHPLRSFLAWRRRHHPRLPFAWADSVTGLQREFTLADNILRSVGDVPSGASVERIAEAREWLDHHCLGEFKSTIPLELYPSQLSPEAYAVASLVCALMARAEVVLWDVRGQTFEGLMAARLKRLLAQPRAAAVVVVSTCPAIWGEDIKREFIPAVARRSA